MLHTEMNELLNFVEDKAPKECEHCPYAITTKPSNITVCGYAGQNCLFDTNTVKVKGVRHVLSEDK